MSGSAGSTGCTMMVSEDTACPDTVRTRARRKFLALLDWQALRRRPGALRGALLARLDGKARVRMTKNLTMRVRNALLRSLDRPYRSEGVSQSEGVREALRRCGLTVKAGHSHVARLPFGGERRTDLALMPCAREACHERGEVGWIGAHWWRGLAIGHRAEVRPPAVIGWTEGMRDRSARMRPSPMGWRQLERFAAIARFGTFGHAANAVGMRQPSLTCRIAAQERVRRALRRWQRS